MIKLVTLFFIIVFALASFAGYEVLTEKVTTGDQKIVTGQKQLDQGEQLLAEGKDKLENGKRKLSRAENTFRGVNNIPLVEIINKLPITGMFANEAKQQMHEGSEKISKGEAKIKAGQAQLDAGRLQLMRGEEKIKLANRIRVVLASGATVFTILAIILGVYWRQSLAKVFKRRNA